MGNGVNVAVLRAIEEVERAKAALVAAAPRGRMRPLEVFDEPLRRRRG
jgi:hypothetical protein